MLSIKKLVRKMDENWDIIISEKNDKYIWLARKHQQHYTSNWNGFDTITETLDDLLGKISDIEEDNMPQIMNTLLLI